MKDDFFPQLRSIVSKYETDDIFIIGKGSSIDAIDDKAIQSGIVIGINDAERIVNTDITIFHAEWVKESLRKNKYQSQLYITNLDCPSQIPHVYIPYISSGQETSELLVQRFFSNELYIENIMFITGLKIARIIANLRRQRQNVYLLGFDFDMSHGYSKAIAIDYSGDDTQYQAQFIMVQEHYLLMFLHLLRESNTHIMHVGDKAYSSLDIQAFNQRFLGDNFTINNVRSKIGKTRNKKLVSQTDTSSMQENKVLITAEITTNHFGDTERLCEMAERAANAGADLVKVQKRDVDCFYTREQLESPFNSPFGTTFGDYRHALELTIEQFKILDKTCSNKGIRWFVSVLDISSFNFILPMETPFIKLPSTISQHHQLLELVAQEYSGAIVVSTGLSSQDYENYILDTFSDCSQLYLLQCNSAYPTPPQDCNIAVIRHYSTLSKRYPHIFSGYSSHDFGSEASMLAVAAGAKMIEKHVKLGDTKWAHFDDVALDLETDDFKNYVKDIRRAESMCGLEYKKVNESEHHKYWFDTQKS